MDVKARPVAAPMVVYNWSGCYIGANIGGGWDRTSQDQIGKVDGTIINPPGNFGSSTGRNFIGGGQIGCDYQFSGNWVIGIQGMFDFGNINHEHTLPAFPAFYSTNSVKNEFTVTGRIGYLFAPQMLAYFKGGGAWARIDHNIYGVGPPVFLSESANGVNRSGWTVGGGLEWMFSPGWSVFGENGLRAERYQLCPGSRYGRRRRCGPDSPRGQSVSGRRELQVQLRRPGRRKVLSLAQLTNLKPRHRPGLLVFKDHPVALFKFQFNGDCSSATETGKIHCKWPHRVNSHPSASDSS